MKLAIIYNKKKFSGKLTKLFTGCYAYHVGWVDEENDKFYDMHYNRRRQVWSEYSRNKTYTSHDVPGITKEYLENQMDTDESFYGWLDYVLFSLRPIYHLFGKSTINAGGIICSEMINIDMRANGINTPWEITDAPPSPCDFVNWLIKGIKIRKY